MESPYPTAAYDATHPSCAFSLSASFKAVSNRINQKDTLKGSPELLVLFSVLGWMHINSSVDAGADEEGCH